MKKIIALLLFVSTVVFGQTYPSPTFNNLTVLGTVSGVGFTNYFASPPAIGGTLANTGVFTNLATSGTASFGANVSANTINGLPQYSALLYGAKCDGTTNDSTSIQSAITAAQAAGGGVVVLPTGKTCAIGSTLAVTASNVGFVCPGGGLNVYEINPSVQPTTGCWLKWTGSTGGTMMSFIAPSGSSTNGPLQGVFLLGVDFNGNAGTAANGVVINSVWGSTFSDDGFWNFSNGYIFDISTVRYNGSNFAPGGAADDQGDLFTNLSFANYNSTASTPIRLGGWAGGGTSNEVNVSYSVFKNLSVGVNGNATGIVLNGADNNTFIMTSVNSFGGSAPSVDFSTLDVAGNAMASSSNTFIGLGGNHAAIARGQTTTPACVSGFTLPYGATSCTFGNVIENADASNSMPLPTIEPGAQLRYRYSNGWSGGQTGGQSALGQTQAMSLVAMGAVTNETLRIANGSSDQLVLADGTGANAWALNLDGSNNLRFNPAAGTSSEVLIPQGTTSSSTTTGALVVTGGVGIGGTLNVGAGGIGSSGSVTATGGSFTVLSASGNDALTYANTSGQSIPNATPTVVTNWTKTFDRLNTNFVPSTGVFTAPATGYYAVSACLLYSANVGVANSSVDVLIVANSVTIAHGISIRESATSSGQQACAAADVAMTSGQTMVIQANQSTGSALTLQTATPYSYVSINRIP
jgi:hypothetical protein